MEKCGKVGKLEKTLKDMANIFQIQQKIAKVGIMANTVIFCHIMANIVKYEKCISIVAKNGKTYKTWQF